MPKTKYVSPEATLYMTGLLLAVRPVTRVPVFLVHCDADRSGSKEPGGTCTPVSVMVPLAVTVPVRPLTVMDGLHDAKSGTLNVRLTVMVLLSQGYGDDCEIPHFHVPALDTELNAAVRI